MADALVDMAYTKDELREQKKEMAVGCNGQPNPYPWGLSMHLEKEVLDKLGLKELPEVGSTMQITATVEVTSVAQSASRDRDMERSVGLQITRMAVSTQE